MRSCSRSLLLAPQICSSSRAAPSARAQNRQQAPVGPICRASSMLGSILRVLYLEVHGSNHSVSGPINQTEVGQLNLRSLCLAFGLRSTLGLQLGPCFCRDPSVGPTKIGSSCSSLGHKLLGKIFEDKQALQHVYCSANGVDGRSSQHSLRGDLPALLGADLI